jgi:FixJ family two-component response regulator
MFSPPHVGEREPSEPPSHSRVLRVQVETYGSARDFLAAEPEGRTAVALVDIKMEGMTGFELQEELAARHSAIPLIFITAFDDAATRDRIRRTGWECLVRPFEEEVLLGAVGRVRKPGDDPDRYQRRSEPPQMPHRAVAHRKRRSSCAKIRSLTPGAPRR